MLLKIGENGTLVDQDGKPLEIEGEAVTVDTDTLVKDRLARQKKQLDGELEKQREKIAALEATADKSPQLMKMLADLRAEKAEIEQNLQRVQQDALDAQRKAEAEVASQIAKANKEAEEARNMLTQERQARIREYATNLILTNTGGAFNDPATDVVPNLLNRYVREPLKDADGKTIEGQFLDRFSMTFKRDGVDVTEAVDVQKAIELWGDQHPHHLKASGHSGSGGGNYTNTQGLKRGQMSDKDKSDFVAKHGQEAFKKLPA